MTQLRLEDGTLVPVPQGVDPRAFLAKIDAERAKVPSPLEGVSELGKAGLGIQQGVQSSLKNVASLLPGVKFTDTSDTDKALLESGAGKAGSIAGNLLTTVPMIGGVGLAAKAGALSRTPILAKALQFMEAGAGRRAALQGGVTAGATANPEDRAGAAVTGAALGGGLGYAGNLLGRVAGKGLVEINPNAQALEHELNQTLNPSSPIEIPLSQSAPEGNWARYLSNQATSALPGAGAKLNAQVAATRGVVDELTATKAAPPNVKNIVLGDNIQANMESLATAWKDAYEPFSKFVINASSDWLKPLMNNLKGASRVTRDGILGIIKQYTKNVDGTPVIKGSSLSSLREDLLNFGRKVHDNAVTSELSRVEGSQVHKAAIDGINSLVKDQLPGKLGDEFASLGEPHKAYDVLRHEVRASAAPGGHFDYGSLAQRGANAASVDVGAAGKGPLQQYATRVHNTIGEVPQKPSIWRTAAVLGASTTLGGLPLLPIAGLASRNVQRVLQGRTGVQKAVADALRKHATGLQAAGLVGRSAAETYRRE
jgi:hypothetical protein